MAQRAASRAIGGYVQIYLFIVAAVLFFVAAATTPGLSTRLTNVALGLLALGFVVAR